MLRRTGKELRPCRRYAEAKALQQKMCSRELLSEKRHEKQRLRGANRNLAKVGVEGSNPFARSNKTQTTP
jgi:hypothetical protein